MLDLPHSHCNDIYVPWLSKGQRRTKSFQNKITFRGHAFDLAGLPGSEESESVSSSRQPTSIASMMKSKSILSLARYDSPIPQSNSPIPRYDSPISMLRCDGWCRHDLIPHATVVSLSACAILQRSWEGPRVSLTAVLCELLEKQPSPSYRTLMTHVNFQLHASCRALHEYTLNEKKKAARGEEPSFDGEMNDFQAPQLSSLAKLDLDETLQL